MKSVLALQILIFDTFQWTLLQGVCVFMETLMMKKNVFVILVSLDPDVIWVSFLLTFLC